MKAKVLLTLAATMVLSSCNIVMNSVSDEPSSSSEESVSSSYDTSTYSEESSSSISSSSESISSSESESSLSSSESISSATSESSSESIPSSSSESSSIEEDEDDGVHITLNKAELDLVTGKYEYLTVNFPEGYSYDPEGGRWESSDPTIATVSQYGKVTGVASGVAKISYIDSNNRRSSFCKAYIHTSSETIEKKWLKVEDVDTIAAGDIIAFGCPSFGVTASINKKSGYLLPSSSSFSSNGKEMTSLGADTAEFYVGEGKEGSFTLENQDGYYLAGKSTTAGTGLSFVKSKGQIDWIFERPEGFDNDYCVNYDIADDYWLMFNKINASDIRFNLYDSNETALMKMPFIYRLEIVR